MGRLKTFFRANKVATYFFVVGCVFGLGSLWLQSGDEYYIPGYATLIKLVGLITISVAVVIISSSAKRALFANIGVLMVLVFGFELICFLLLGLPQKEKKDFGLPFVTPEHISAHLGTVPYSDSVYHETKVLGADTVFDVHYSFDENSLRITPDHDSTKQKFAAFYGCSIAFGLGLNDNQTFPYYFQKNSEFNAYNFAYSGYGTNHMLARLQYQNIKEVVSEKDGIGVYIFFWDHIERAIGSMQRYTEWVSNAPYFYMKDGELTRDRAFKDGRYVISKIYEKMYQSSIIKYFNVNFPLSLNESHFDLVTEMIRKSKEEFKNQSGSDEFYVIIYPTYQDLNNEEFSQFIHLLDKKGISYIDLTKNYIYNEKSTLGGDPHPNAKTNEELSKRLIKELNKLRK